MTQQPDAQASPAIPVHLRTSLRACATEALGALVRNRLGEAAAALDSFTKAAGTIEHLRDETWRAAIARLVLLGGLVSAESFAEALLGELQSVGVATGHRDAERYRAAVARATRAPGLTDETLARIVELLEGTGPGLLESPAPPPSVSPVSA